MGNFFAQICFINFFSAESVVFQKSLHGGQMAKNSTFPESTPKSYPSCKISSKSDFRFLSNCLCCPENRTFASPFTTFLSSHVCYIFGQQPTFLPHSLISISTYLRFILNNTVLFQLNVCAAVIKDKNVFIYVKIIYLSITSITPTLYLIGMQQWWQLIDKKSERIFLILCIQKV